MGVPPNGWFIEEIQLKWMIWGYPYFRKPPYVCVCVCLYIYIYIHMYMYVCVYVYIYIYTKYTPRVHGQLCFLVSNPFNWGYIYQSNPNIKTKLWDISYIYIYIYIYLELKICLL